MGETAGSEAQPVTVPSGLSVHVLQKGSGNPAAQDKITSGPKPEGIPAKDHSNQSESYNEITSKYI